MAREIINDLADIIRDHQDTLPNLEELDVKDKFKEVYKETEDGNLVIENDMHTHVLDYARYIWRLLV